MTVQRFTIASREEWLALRAPNIGASEIGALFGCHPFKTHLALHAEKAGLMPVEGPTSEIMERGQIFEPAVAEAVRRLRPEWRLSKNDEYLSWPEARLGATPDYLAYDPKRGSVGVVQTKVIAMREFEKHWQEGPPLAYILQTAQEVMLDCMSWSRPAGWGAIAVLAVSDYRHAKQVYEFDRDINAEAKITRAVTAFWDAVAEGSLPAADFSRDGEVIRALYEKGGGEPKNLTRHNRIAGLCEEKLAWARRHGSAERALEVIDAEIADILGDAERGDHPLFNITRKPQWTGGFEMPRKQVRVLRVTRKKVKGQAEATEEE